MYQTIIGMAQNFVGTNNINLLMPNGQFGTRLKGGKDSSSPRYIFTQLNSLCKSLFDENAEGIYDYTDDDGVKTEPTIYSPTICLLLCNGSKGIGTGYSTEILQYNPLDIIANHRRILNGEQPIEMIPWYNGFNGRIVKGDKPNCYETYGNYEIISDTKIKITELPIGTWTESYKEWCDESINSEFMESADRLNDEVGVILTFTSETMQKLRKENNIYEALKLTTKLNATNMTAFNTDFIIQKYETTDDILIEFSKHKLEIMQKIKDYLINKKEKEIELDSERVRFLELVVDKKVIKLTDVNKADLINSLANHEFKEEVCGTNYCELINMHIYKLTIDEKNKIKQDLLDKRKEIDLIKNKTVKTMWLEQLDECEIEYKKWKANFDEMKSNNTSTNNNKTKGKPKKNSAKTTSNVKIIPKTEQTSKTVQITKKTPSKTSSPKKVGVKKTGK